MGRLRSWCARALLLWPKGEADRRSTARRCSPPTSSDGARRTRKRRLCACGQPIARGRRGPASKWHIDACRKRAERAGTGSATLTSARRPFS